jgi:EAL domain-containing protein (putative c-di-GMP-specific phosphodiesterase class I)
LQVTAEGIETSGELEILREIGCNLAQGFYLAAPMPAPELEHLVLTQSLPIA